MLSYTISLILRFGKPLVPRLNHLTEEFISLKLILSVDVAYTFVSSVTTIIDENFSALSSPSIITLLILEKLKPAFKLYQLTPLLGVYMRSVLIELSL